MHFLLTYWSIQFRSIVPIAKTEHAYFSVYDCSLRWLWRWLTPAIVLVAWWRSRSRRRRRRWCWNDEISKCWNEEHRFIIGMGHDEKPYLCWMLRGRGWMCSHCFRCWVLLTVGYCDARGHGRSGDGRWCMQASPVAASLLLSWASRVPANTLPLPLKFECVSKFKKWETSLVYRGSRKF